MKADILTIGDEILIGQIVDTNSAWMANYLESNGIQVRQITSISDSPIHIAKALEESISHADVVFITGGLGPTNDDVTKKTLVDFFEDELIFDKDVSQHIHKFFANKGRDVNKFTELQAMVPSRCKVIKNDLGTAPGMWFDEMDTVIISMPGVPYEMKGIMKKSVDEIKGRFHLPQIIHKTVFIRGIVESHLAALLADWEQQLPIEIKLAYLPSKGNLRMRFTARGLQRKFLEDLIDAEIIKMKDIIGPYFSPYETKNNEEIIGYLLTKHKYTICAAESCTGGNISKSITSAEGSSNYFKGGVVAYSSEVKKNILNVSTEVIDQYGIVSEEVARAMAENAKSIFSTDFSIATTGLASLEDVDGISGGTICYAISTPDGIFSNTIECKSSRKENVIYVTNVILNSIILLIENNSLVDEN